jgi:CDP-glucose 4,6-dehydratase
MIDPAFWSGRRVLLTGQTGFKGAWLALWLERLGARTVGLSLAPEAGARPNLYDAAGVARGMDSRIGDIRDYDTVRAAMADAAPDVVLHLAAQPFVRRSYRDPLETFGSNVMGTANVLEAARHQKSVRAVVCVTTDKVYKNLERAEGYSEDDRLGGKDPYSASKAAAELVAACWRDSLYALEGRVRMATARGGNVVGGGDWGEDRLPPDVVEAFVRGEPLTLRNPLATRPWQHVLDLVSGYMLLAQKLASGNGDAAQAWNFGPASEAEITVEDYCRRLADAWRADAAREGATPPELAIRIEPSGLPEARLLKLDSSRVRAQLGWRPPLDIDATMQLTAQWYRRYYADPSGARRLCDAQIDDYERRLAAGRP